MQTGLYDFRLNGPCVTELDFAVEKPEDAWPQTLAVAGTLIAGLLGGITGAILAGMLQQALNQMIFGSWYDVQ